MKVVPIEAVGWEKDHPTGALAFKYLLTGDDASRQFRSAARAAREAFRDRAPSSQLRSIPLPYSWRHECRYGVRLRAGQLGYFTEGAPYGPQDDPLEPSKPGERIHLTLQFGGATGYNISARSACVPAGMNCAVTGSLWTFSTIPVAARLRTALTRSGSTHSDRRWNIRSHDIRGLSSWTRFHSAGFPMPMRRGLRRKHLGTYGAGNLVQTSALASRRTACLLHRADARRLLFVLAGSGAIDGAEITYHSAIQLDPGEQGRIVCREALEFLVLGLPAITAAGTVARSEAMTQPA